MSDSWQVEYLHERIRMFADYFREQAATASAEAAKDPLTCQFSRGLALAFEIAAERFAMLAPPLPPSDPDALLKERARDAVIEAGAVDVVSGRQEEAG